MKRVAAAVFVICASASTAAAHHSFTAEFDNTKPIKLTGAEFDNTKPIKLTGTVTMVRWSNPHGWIYIDVKDADGKVVNWAFELAAANALYRRGTKPEDFPVGSQVTIDGFLARNGTPTAASGKLTFPDGRTIAIGAAAVAGDQK